MRFGAVLAALVTALGATPALAEGCAGPLYEAARRLVGTWTEHTVTGEGEVFVGTLNVRLELDDCAFSQRFTTPDGAALFTSLGHVDGRAEWLETFVFRTGRVARYRWSPVGGEILMYEVTAGDDQRSRRLRLTDLEQDSFNVIEERSDDGGVTWESIEITRTRRLPEDP